MAKLTTRINELAGAVRDKFNQIMPRLLPPGGTVGQALVKASNADNSVQWADVEGGSGGVTGPITDEQLPLVGEYFGPVEDPTGLTLDQYGRVKAVARNGRRARNRGAWAAPLPSKTYDFAQDGPPTEIDYTGTPYVFLTNADNSGVIRVMDMPVVEAEDGSHTARMRINATVTTSTPFSITYRMSSVTGESIFAVLVNGSMMVFEQGSTLFQTFSTTLEPGTNQILFAYQNSDARGGDRVVFSSMTIPVETYFFGDVVSHAGAIWQCVSRGTTDVPGSGDGWVRFGSDILPTNNLWNGTNTFAGSVALNGTSTAVTPAVGTNSTAIATTEFVTSATGALVPRLVPLGGSSGQVLTRDSTGNLVWASAAGGASTTANNTFSGENNFDGYTRFNDVEFRAPANFNQEVNLYANTTFGANVSFANTPTVNGQAVYHGGNKPVTSLVTDTAPALGAALDLKGLGFKQTLQTGTQNVMRVQAPAANSAGAISLNIRNSIDSQNMSEVRLSTNTLGQGFLYLGGDTIYVNRQDGATLYAFPRGIGDVGQYPAFVATGQPLAWTSPVAAVGFFCGGGPQAGEMIGRVSAASAFTVVAANCRVTADTAATASTAIRIRKNGTQIGTATFAAGAVTATVAFTNTAIAKGDLITFHAPDTADATLANVSGTITN